MKSFGGWTQFMITYGLKPHEPGDVKEAYEIVKKMAENDRK